MTTQQGPGAMPSGAGPNLCLMAVAVAPFSPADAISGRETVERLRQQLAGVHGVSVLSAEPVIGGVELQVTAHSVQAAEFAEYALGGLELGQVWAERDGLLTLPVVLRRNV